MSKRSQQKRQARAKEKKIARRRQMGAGPLARLGGEETCRCWLSRQEEDNRMQSLQVFRSLRGGGSIAGAFLIDLDCLGLKDAFIRLNIDYHDMREQMKIQSEQVGIEFLHISLDAARNLVSQAITWTRNHPFFRLPDNTERAVRVLGGLGENPSTDTREFGHEGGLLYVGRKRDLERRLVGMTVEEFMQRDGVDVLFHLGDESFREEEFDEEWDEDDPGRPLSEAERQTIEEHEDALKAMQEKLKQNLVDGTIKWCLANGLVPHPALERAADLILASSAEALSVDDDDEAEALARENEKSLMSLEDAKSRKEIEEADAQIAGFSKSFESPEAFSRAVGLSEESAAALLSNRLAE